MKAIMISIKPQYVADILNGKKTLEIRKTCPEIFKRLKPYEGASFDVYIYATKKYDECLWYKKDSKCYVLNYGKPTNDYLNGKVVAKFTLNKVEEIKLPYTYFGTNKWVGGEHERTLQTETLDEKDILKLSCLTEEEIYKYLDFKHSPNNVGYAWHIDNLVVFDKPKELKEFYKVGCEEYFEKHVFVDHPNFRPIYESELKQFQLTRAPQSWCYVEV